MIMAATTLEQRTQPRGLNTTHFELLTDLVRGRHVLDVGCVDHKAAIEQSDRWLHKHIVRSAASTLGLDIVETEAAKLRELGYDIVCGDATSISLGRKFDVIIAGEIIEHIANPGAFVANMGRHLNDGGRLVLTTPYAHYAWHFAESLLWQPDKRWNPEHVAWYCPFTLGNLVERAGLTVEACYRFTRSRKLLGVLKSLGLPCPGPLASSFAIVARTNSHGSRNTAGVAPGD
jgi:SAM-dependent methyltransferase